MEVANPEEIADAIDMPSPVGTALCMAAALKKDHEIGNSLLTANLESFCLKVLILGYLLWNVVYSDLLVAEQLIRGHNVWVCDECMSFLYPLIYFGSICLI